MSYDCKVEVETGLNNTHEGDLYYTTGYFIEPPVSPVDKNEIGSSTPSTSSLSSDLISSHLATLHEQIDFKDGTSITLQGSYQKKPLKPRLTKVWMCCKQTYYATLCAVLILVGCPMAAVGSQEEIDWALYIGIVMVLIAFLIAIIAPNVRYFIQCVFPNRLGAQARVMSIPTLRKVRVKSLPSFELQT